MRNPELDAVMMLKDAKAEIEQLRAALRELTEGYRLFISTDNPLTRAVMSEFVDMSVIRAERVLGEVKG